MKYKIITIALTVLMISSCGSTNKVNNQVSNQTSAEMLEQGFLKGQIVFSDVEGDCAIAIKTIGAGAELLDPTNLDEEFKIDGQQIWFKFTSLRMQNRCEKARPIKIKAIQLRKKTE